MFCAVFICEPQQIISDLNKKNQVWRLRSCSALPVNLNRSCFSLSKEHERQRCRWRRRRPPGEPRLHLAVPAGPGEGPDAVPHHLHRGHWPGHHYAGTRLAGGRHGPGAGLPEGGRSQDRGVGGQDCPGGPGAGIHCAEGKLSHINHPWAAKGLVHDKWCMHWFKKWGTKPITPYSTPLQSSRLVLWKTVDTD